MKKIMMIFIVGMLCLGFTSALEIDNWKSELDLNEDSSITIGEENIIYNPIWEKYEPVKIDNLFGLGETLWSGAIEEHTEYCEEDCNSTMNIYLANDGPLIEDFKTETIKEDGSRIEQDIRSYQFYILNGEKEIKYNVGDSVVAGNYKVKLEGEKKPSRSVDWIIKVEGKWIEEWAVWESLYCDEYCLIVSADAMDETAIEVNDVIVTELTGTHNLWKINSSTSDDNLSRAKVLGTLYFGEDDPSPNDNRILNARILNITNISSITSNNDVDGNTSIYFHLWNFTSAGANDKQQQNFTFTNGNNNYVSSWSFLRGSNSQNRFWFVMPKHSSSCTTTCPTALNSATLENSQEILTDRNFDEQNSENASFDFYNGNAGAFNLKARGLFLVKDGTMARQGGIQGANNNLTDFQTDFGIPKITFAGDLEVKLNSPINNYASDSNIVLFNCSASLSDGATISNISLWTNQSGTLQQENITLNLNGTSNETTWNHNVENEGNTLWTCQACDSDGNCELAQESRVVIIDSTPPLINILYPLTSVTYQKINSNLTLNWTISDTNLDSCWYEFNGINTTITCLDLNTTIEINGDKNRTLNLWANDSSNNQANDSSTWVYRIFDNSRTFNSATTEGSSEDFILNFTKDSETQISTIDLIYNNTKYSSTYTISNNEVIASNTINIPTTSEIINNAFHWNITLSDSVQVSTTSENQSVNLVQFGDCETYDNLIYNYTIYDEENQTALTNATIEIQVNMFDSTRTFEILNFSKKYENTNNATMCFNGSLLTTINYSVDSVVKYFSNESRAGNGSQIYSIEYYNLLNDIVSNTTVPKNIKLYDLKIEDATEFQLTFRDADFVLASNILVYLYRQYVADGDFKVVEVPLTDSNGQTVLHLVKNDVVYNLIMVDIDGNIIATFNKIIAFCQDFTIGQCTINLNADADGDTIYNYTEDLGIAYTRPTYSNSTNLVSIDFVSNNLSAVLVTSQVISNSPFGNRTVCTNSLKSASGTIYCNVSSVIETDRFLFVNLFVEGDLKAMQVIDLEADDFNFGITDGAFFAFLFILFLITMFMEDKQSLIIALVVGWAVVLSLALIKGALIGSFSGGIWLIVCAIIFLWKLKSEESS